MDTKSGTVILLNGTSSSGKSTIAKELQNVLQEPYLYISVDTFLHQLPPWMFTVPKRFNASLPWLNAGFYSSCAAIARSGISIIIDSVLDQSYCTPVQCAAAFEGLDVLFVGVHCSLETLESREKERGNRQLGLARHQYNRVHANSTYDVEVNTTDTTVADCVSGILDVLQSGRQPSAFKTLRSVGMKREQSVSRDA